MIGLVLAAGVGRRLSPDTDALPKTLLPVDGQTTILDIALRNFAAAGLRDVAVVVGHAADAVGERAASLERAHGVRVQLVHNDRARDWNNAYSLWLAREFFREGVLLANGDTVHPVSVEKALLAAPDRHRSDVVIAVDDIKPLGDEEMKVTLDDRGLLTRITKQMDPGRAYGEYIGVSLDRAGRRCGARGRARGHLAARPRALLRGWLPGTRGPRRGDRGRAHRCCGLG